MMGQLEVEVKELVNSIEASRVQHVGDQHCGGSLDSRVDARSKGSNGKLKVQRDTLLHDALNAALNLSCAKESQPSLAKHGLQPLHQSTKNVVYENLESESALFCISPPPGHLCGPYFKDTARTNNGNPAVLFSQRCKPHLANWQKKMCLNRTFFRHSARSPHRGTKPSRGWLWIAVRKPRLVLSSTVAARN